MKDFLRENIALVITIGGTILLLVLMVGILSLSSKSNPNTEQVISSDPSVLVRDDSHVYGNKDATVEVVEFSDFQCPACSYYYPEFEKFKTEYKDQIKFVFRNLPLISIHANAFDAAVAAETAGAQDKFWQYHNILFEKQAEWSNLSKDELKNKFVEYAELVEVADIDKFKTDLENETYKYKVEQDLEDADKLGLNATPTVFMNGTKVSNPTYENLKSLAGF